MKKLTVLLLIMAALIAPSCKNNNKNKVQDPQEQKELTEAEKMAQQELQINIQNLIESSKKLSTPSFLKKDGKGNLSLTDKEKMVKPEYLLNPSVTNDLVTLSQKYRALGIISIDKTIASLYDMPTDEFDAAMGKLVADVNDPVLIDMADGQKVLNAEDRGLLASDILEKEYEAGRAPLFWEAVTAGVVEQSYVLSNNIEKFATAFNDETASEFTYNFVSFRTASPNS
jgi:hypothetical protein